MPNFRVLTQVVPEKSLTEKNVYMYYIREKEGKNEKGDFHLCPRRDFLQTLHINNSLYTNYENVFIELDS